MCCAYILRFAVPRGVLLTKGKNTGNFCSFLFSLLRTMKQKKKTFYEVLDNLSPFSLITENPGSGVPSSELWLRRFSHIKKNVGPLESKSVWRSIRIALRLPSP